MTKLSYSTLFACSLSIAASAQDMLPVANEFRVNQNVPSDQYMPQVAVGPSDDYIVVWKSWMQDDNTASIYFRRYNSAHVALSNELLVATGADYNQDVVKVIYWMDGKYIIAWNDNNNVNMRVLNANNTLGATVPLAGAGEWDIAVQGNTVAILYGTGNDQLYIRGYDMSTNDFVNDPVLATENASDGYNMPNIRFKSDGSLVAIFARDFPSRIYRKTFDSDFLAQINETTVYDQPQSSLSCIDVSTNASDEILISTKWGVNGTDVYMAWLLDANGNALIDDLGVFSCSYAYYTAECALFDNGDFVIVMGNWLSLNDPDDYQVRGIYFSNYNFQNTGVEVMNTTTAGRQTYPAVEKRSDGGFMVVWEGNGFQGDTQGINARAYTGATFPGVQATSLATLVVDEDGNSATLNLRLGTQPTGDVVVDVYESDNTEVGIDVGQMTFTTSNWDEPQSITVTGQDDPDDDGDIALNIVAVMNPITQDPTYAAMGPKYFPVINLDNDAVFTMPLMQTFCRNDGMASVNVLVMNEGSPVGDPVATSNDQTVVDDGDITVIQMNATTFAVTIGTLENNVPGFAIITVTVSDGTFAYFDSFEVTTQGATPVITQNGGELTSTPGVNYQWFLNDAFIPDGMEQTYEPTENGIYTVLVIDANGCSNLSEDFNFMSTGVADVTADALWIGPLREAFWLNAPSAGELRIVDVTGKVVATARVVAGLQIIALPGLASGTYTLLLNGEAIRAVKE